MTGKIDKYKWVLLIVLIISFLFFYWRGKRLEDRIANNHVVLCGNILSMRAGKGVNVIFEFLFHNERIQLNIAAPRTTIEKFKKGVSKILIVVDVDNPKNCAILADDSDYEKYRIVMQDTVSVRCN